MLTKEAGASRPLLLFFDDSASVIVICSSFLQGKKRFV